ncbi:GTPase Era, mitochondrial-like isoform X4 [Macrobrachium nipponense]|uniref:GTPase Era, mitochondrial-like isoform X4 n=1 Tax=Macrobrachium nipponense TaxID=159736 RepID=UPI0030C83951
MVAQKKIEKTQDLDKEILIQKALNRKEKLLKKESENTPPQVNGKTDLTESADTLENCSHLTQHEVAEFTKDRKGWPYFQDVFMISALKESGVDDLRNYLLSKAYSAPWLFSSKVVTDQNPEEIALMTVREKFLETFKNEIPYTVKFDIERWDVSESETLGRILKTSKGTFCGKGPIPVSHYSKGSYSKHRVHTAILEIWRCESLCARAG